MKTLNVDLGGRSYPIFIGSGLISQSALFSPYIKGRQVLVVTNETVAPLYLDQLLSSLAAYQVDVVMMPDGEKFKTLDVLSTIYDVAMEKRHNRTTTFIALGGGVVGDMCGYAAASYQRGVNFIQVPTTLLSQVDSSVGGKTGVNHPLGKNMIGAFHQPQAVIADIDSLGTLDDRELAAGLAEVIKYGLLGDIGLLSWLESNIDVLNQRDPELLAEAVARSCQNKADIVAQDERESGKRALLNFGHTFGHAIETTMGYGQWLHGEAVGAGMVLAADISARLGWITSNDSERATRLISRARLPVVSPSTMTVEQFLDAMAVDKKVIDGSLRLVLLKALGEAVVTSDFEKSKLIDALNAALS
jgi:3-dehydroquinate synthase